MQGLGAEQQRLNESQIKTISKQSDKESCYAFAC
jgi:hypothetical protein